MIGSPIACNSGTTNLDCSIASGNTVNVEFIPVDTASYLYNFSISNVENPYSF
jgi:hypothetical protein